MCAESPSHVQVRHQSLNPLYVDPRMSLVSGGGAADETSGPVDEAEADEGEGEGRQADVVHQSAVARSWQQGELGLGPVRVWRR